MQTFPKLYPWLIGITLGIIAALLALPASRMLLIQQGSAAFGVVGGFSGQDATGNARAARIAKAHPEDTGLQLAATLSLPTPQETQEQIERDSPALDARLRQRWLRVDALSKQYPNSALIAAAALRTALDGVVHHDPSMKTDPRDAELFVQEARSGEAIDPGNADFPLMQAVGLYALHRDADAADAVLRAGTMPRWNEYVAEETEGRWRLAEARGGTVDAFGRTAISAAVLFPQYAALREVARRVTALAERDEQAGQIAQGLALRRAVMRVGGLMRAQSTTAIGSLVGIALVPLGEGHPDRLPDPVNFAAMSREQRSQWRTDQYCAFLARNGQSDEARWVRAEATADTQVLATLHRGLDSPQGVYNLLIHRLLPLSLDGVMLLANALWVLLLGSGAYLLISLQQWRSRENGASLPPLTGASLAVAGLILIAALVAAPVLIGGAFLNGVFSDAILTSGTVVFLVGFLALIAQTIRRRVPLREALQAVLLGIGAAILSTSAVLLVYRQILAVMGLSGQGGQPELMETISLRSGFEIVAAPLTLFLVFGVVSRLRRMRLSTGLTHGFAAAAVPMTALATVAYACLMLVTLRVENRVNQALTLQVRHEGEYLAAITGTQWPGLVMEPPAANKNE